jgi:hypothetical protein
MTAWFKLRLPAAPEVKILKQGKKRLRTPGETVKVESRREEGMLILEGIYSK